MSETEEGPSVVRCHQELLSRKLGCEVARGLLVVAMEAGSRVIHSSMRKGGGLTWHSLETFSPCPPRPPSACRRWVDSWPTCGKTLHVVSQMGESVKAPGGGFYWLSQIWVESKFNGSPFGAPKVYPGGAWPGPFRQTGKLTEADALAGRRNPP